MSIDLLAIVILTSYMVGAGAVLFMFQLRSSNPGKYIPIWISFGFEILAFVVVFVPAYLGHTAFAIFITVIAIMTQHEIFNAAAYDPSRSLRVIASVGAVLLIGGVAVFGLEALVLVLPGVLMLTFITGLFMPTERNQLHNLMLACFTLNYPAVFLAFTVALQQLDNGFVWIVTLYGIIEIHDGFANMMGRIMGKRQIFPEISPGKSMEGALFGIGMTLTLIPIMKLWVYPEIALIHLFGLVVLVDALTIGGDLIASKMKRMVNIKDSGQLIPYRGGFLDIYDALILASPAVYVYISHVFV